MTTRTIQGRFLLRPGAHLNELLVGVFGRAQRLYQMRMHACVVLSNHFHLLVSPESSQQLAAFMNFVNGNIAKEAGRLHQWPDRFWSRRYQAIPVSEEESAQVGRLTYLLAHGVKEGFVARPQDWPGVHCAQALLDGVPLAGIWVDRTRELRNRRAGKELEAEEFIHEEHVTFEPLPCWTNLDPDQVRRRVVEVIDEIVASARSTGRPLGHHAILRQHPHEKPTSCKRTPAPRVHAATRAIRLMMKAAYLQFVARFREAAEQLRRGDLPVRFPVGAFPPPFPCSASG